MDNKKRYPILQAGFLVGLFSFMILVSCSNEDYIIAKVDDSELLASEAQVIMKHLGYQNSEKRQFLEDWCQNEMYRIEIEKQNPKLNQIISWRSKAFAGDLAAHYLVENEMNKKLNNRVSDLEIEAYYQKHKEEFALQDFLVKGLMIKVRNDSEQLSEIKRLFHFKNESELTKLNALVKQEAEDFYYDDQNWIYFTEFSKNIPMKGLNKDNVVLNRIKTYFTKDGYCYFINIIDFQLKDAIPPMDFLSPQIKSIILSTRANQLKIQLESKIFNQIKNKYDFEINL